MRQPEREGDADLPAGKGYAGLPQLAALKIQGSLRAARRHRDQGSPLLRRATVLEALGLYTSPYCRQVFLLRHIQEPPGISNVRAVGPTGGHVRDAQGK